MSSSGNCVQSRSVLCQQLLLLHSIATQTITVVCPTVQYN